MPASQPVEFYRGLEGTIEPVGDESEVYFTDESPSFQLTLSNPTDFEFVEDSAILWVIAIGEGEPEPIYSNQLEFELGPNESKSFEIGGQLLAYEGHGVVGLNSGAARTDENVRVLRPGSINSYDPAYTFSVWDRSQYEALHERPIKLQKATIGLTAAVVFFALVQVAIAVM